MHTSELDPFSIRIRAAGRRELDQRLDRAVEGAIHRARSTAAIGLGILVSRHDHGTVTVELTDQVEPGTIIERDLRQSRACAARHGVRAR